MVAMTVNALNARIQGSRCMGLNTKRQTPNTKETPNPKHQKSRQPTAIWSLMPGVCLVFGVWCLVFFRRSDLADFLFFQCDGPLNEAIGDDPHRGKKCDAEQKPCQREAEDAPNHKLQEKVINQWQPKQHDEKGCGAED